MNTVNSPAVLRESLQASVDALQRRAASDIAESFIEDYVLMDWLEWHGGGLRLTTVGENIRRQEQTRLRELNASSKG